MQLETRSFKEHHGSLCDGSVKSAGPLSCHTLPQTEKYSGAQDQVPAAECREGGFKMHFINFYEKQSYLQKAFNVIPGIIQLPPGSLIKCLQIRGSWLQIAITLVSSHYSKINLLGRNTLTFLQRRLFYIPLAMTPC